LLQIEAPAKLKSAHAGDQAKAPGDSAPAQPALIPLVTEITPELKALALGPSQGGRGGMLTKLEAAEIATRAGGIVIIADGRRPGIVDSVFRGERVGTAFIPSGRMPAKRRWIAYSADVRGRIVVNAGAREAILRGKASLLWSGVIKVERRFQPLDVISIADAEGREFARGIANQGSEDATPGKAAAGAKAAVLVTRNNIVIFEES